MRAEVRAEAVVLGGTRGGRAWFAQRRMRADWAWMYIATCWPGAMNIPIGNVTDPALTCRGQRMADAGRSGSENLRRTARGWGWWTGSPLRWLRIEMGHGS